MSFFITEPRNQTFKALMSTNGAQYRVPRFQRDYAWEQDQWEDLWDDITALETNDEHYMGYIVLKQAKDNQKQEGYFEQDYIEEGYFKPHAERFVIIDGQQRLITLSILVLAAMKQINDLIASSQAIADNQKRLRLMRENFIGSQTLTLQTYNKLNLNRNNDWHFRGICERLALLPERQLSRSNKLLNKCFKFFCEKNMGDNGDAIGAFIERITGSISLTKIVVDNTLNAYKIFETLNARGLQLSTADLLKNYLFITISHHQSITDAELDILDEKWIDIIKQLEQKDFTHFVRYHHNAQHQLVGKNKLFAVISKRIQNEKQALAYLDDLARYAPVYAGLNNSQDELWQGHDYQDIERYLLILQVLGPIRQPFVPLMVAYFKFRPDEFIKLAHYLYVLSIRYNVICQHSPKNQENTYNQLAIQISNDTLQRASHVKNHALFKRLYPTDEEVKNAFKYLRMPIAQSSKKIRFLLTEIDNYLSGHNNSYTLWTLEHIVPYQITSDWINDYGDNYQQDNDRLGNITLLTATDNQTAGTKVFAEKRLIYQKSHCHISKKIAEYESWEPDILNHHQNWLAEQAVQIWRIDYD